MMEFIMRNVGNIWQWTGYLYLASLKWQLEGKTQYTLVIENQQLRALFTLIVTWNESHMIR